MSKNSTSHERAVKAYLEPIVKRRLDEQKNKTGLSSSKIVNEALREYYNKAHNK